MKVRSCDKDRGIVVIEAMGIIFTIVIQNNDLKKVYRHKLDAQVYDESELQIPTAKYRDLIKLAFAKLYKKKRESRQLSLF